MPAEEPQPGQETYAGDYEQWVETAAVASAPAVGGPIGTAWQIGASMGAEFASDQFAEGQADRLQEGVTTRDGPALPGTYYPGYDHPTLQRMVETNMDPGQVNEIGAAWNDLGNTLVEFQTAVSSAVGRSTEDWSGTAGDAARSYFTGVGDWMGGTGQAFQLAANRMNAQSEAAATARAAMPEPVDFNWGDALAMAATETNPFNMVNTMREIRQRFDEKQEAHARAAEVMTTYARTLAETGSAMPAFAPVPTMASGSGEKSAEPGGGGGGFGTGSSVPPLGAGGGGSPGGAGASGGGAAGTSGGGSAGGSMPGTGSTGGAAGLGGGSTGSGSGTGTSFLPGGDGAGRTPVQSFEVGQQNPGAGRTPVNPGPGPVPGPLPVGGLPGGGGLPPRESGSVGGRGFGPGGGRGFGPIGGPGSPAGGGSGSSLGGGRGFGAGTTGFGSGPGAGGGSGTGGGPASGFGAKGPGGLAGEHAPGRG
ncbi:MAG TPA: PPE domain-containing protein, partial [Actinophytocola sp.]|uniref:PPE domain-containing protein n=1 Tax=Actinophytocola sp. TaxID=1872138 RepID=UPI002DDD083C